MLQTFSAQKLTSGAGFSIFVNLTLQGSQDEIGELKHMQTWTCANHL